LGFRFWVLGNNLRITYFDKARWHRLSILCPRCTRASPRSLWPWEKPYEDKEEKPLGEDGFEKIVGQVAGLERKLSIYQLDQFTPQV
jgi:hypothetical protein